MSRRAGAVLAILLFVLATVGRAAVSPEEMLADPALEARARALARELRCLVCQNQSIDDSDAPLARDLRRIVRERLLAGDSDEDVRRFLVDRYGTFVLLKPPLEPATIALWVGPFVVLLGAGLAVFRYLRRPASTTHPEDLTEDERRRLEALLAPPARD
ncbi:Cytochrome c-type biogenesis protein CcmH [bacterium HR40]|nr:Cytochrome c-type biogenesis protein CcmH [bacterium HR40]